MSKFDKIFEAREESKDQKSQNKSPRETTGKDNSGQKKEKTSEKKSASISKETHPQENQNGESAKQRGRPKAKRSDPNYLGFTTYIRRDTHVKAKIALLQEGKNRELSELVESLLTEWLRKNSQS